MTYEEIKPFKQKLVEIAYNNKHLTAFIIHISKTNVFMNVNNDQRGNPELLVPITFVKDIKTATPDEVKREIKTNDYGEVEYFENSVKVHEFTANKNQQLNWEKLR